MENLLGVFAFRPLYSKNDSVSDYEASDLEGDSDSERRSRKYRLAWTWSVFVTIWEGIYLLPWVGYSGGKTRDWRCKLCHSLYHVAIVISRHCFPTQCIPKCIQFSTLVYCPRAVMATICKQLFNFYTFPINWTWKMAYCHSNVRTFLFCHTMQPGLEQSVLVSFFHLTRCYGNYM